MHHCRVDNDAWVLVTKQHATNVDGALDERKRLACNEGHPSKSVQESIVHWPILDIYASAGGNLLPQDTPHQNVAHSQQQLCCWRIAT